MYPSSLVCVCVSNHNRGLTLLAGLVASAPSGLPAYFTDSFQFSAVFILGFVQSAAVQ